MDFQEPNPAPEKASASLNKEILVSTKKGVVYFTLPDSIPPNSKNLSAEELTTVAEQLLLENEAIATFNAPSQSDATTVDSDDPTSSDCSIVRSHLIFPPISEKPLQHNKLSESKPKRRASGPRGRKRKSDLLHLPPKAPVTGYNLYLNEIRGHFKNSGLMFYEITKLVGNVWSNLSLEEKQPYLLAAEIDKRRYKDELWEYRQSGSYQLYLAKKRKKKILNNILSESDMDATDDIDDEDNEELYCRTCDQWFHNLHNKREHLQSRVHQRALVGDMKSELDPKSETTVESHSTVVEKTDQKSVSEVMVDLVSAVSKREKEINNLSMLILEGEAVKDALSQQLVALKEREMQLRSELAMEKELDKNLETKIFALWKVPSLFIEPHLSYTDIESSEYFISE